MEKEIQAVDYFRMLEREVIKYSLAYDFGWSMDKDNRTNFITITFHKYVGKNDFHKKIVVLNNNLSYDLDLAYTVSTFCHELCKEREIYMQEFEIRN